MENNNQKNSKLINNIKIVILYLMGFTVFVTLLIDKSYGNGALDYQLTKSIIILIFVVIAIGIVVINFKKWYGNDRLSPNMKLGSILGMVVMAGWGIFYIVNATKCIMDKNSGTTTIDLTGCSGYVKSTGARMRHTDTYITGENNSKAYEFKVNGLSSEKDKWAVIEGKYKGEKKCDLRVTYYPKTRIVVSVEIINDNNMLIDSPLEDVITTVSDNYIPMTEGDIRLDGIITGVNGLTDEAVTEFRFTEVFYKDEMISAIEMDFDSIDSFDYEINDVNEDGKDDVIIKIKDVDGVSHKFIILHESYSEGRYALAYEELEDNAENVENTDNAGTVSEDNAENIGTVSADNIEYNVENESDNNAE